MNNAMLSKRKVNWL